MADTRIDDPLPQDSGGWRFMLVAVNPTGGDPVPRWQVGEIAVENAENVFVPYVMEKPAAGGGQGTKSVTTSGTPELLSAGSVPCRAVVLMGLRTNTGYVAVGFSNVVRAALALQNTAIHLGPGESAPIAVRNLNLLWIDVSVNAEGIAYTYVV